MNEKQKIKLLIWATPILGILSQLIGLLEYSFSEGLRLVVRLFILLSPNIHLGFIDSEKFLKYNFTSHMAVNYLSLGVYVLLFLGAILYKRSSGKEQRLLRTFFAVILMTKALMLFNTALVLAKTQTPMLLDAYKILLPLGIASNIAWGYGAWYLLNVMSRGRVLQVSDSTYKGDYLTNHKYVRTTRWERFAHLIIDTILCVLICSPLLFHLMKIELQGLASIAGDKGAFYILIIFCRFLYYPFLEWLLGASPAKLLTETRILKNDGGRISLGTAFARTAGRHIPFEAFSYLGGEGAKGWHDACGYSIVVKEQRTGVKARMYLLILPVGLLLGAVTYFGLEWYNDYRSDVLKNSYHKYNGKNIENQLEHLSEGTIIFLSSEPLYYDWEPFAFKVTTIGTDSITGRMISLGTYGYDVTHKEIDEAFRLAEDTIPLTRLSRTVIYGNYVQQVKGRSYLPEGKIELKKKNYSIADVYQPSSPSLFYENPCKEGIISKVFHLQSTGANATLTSIELLEGKATWDITTPMMVSQETYYPMTIEPELNGEVYKIRLTLQDSLGRVYQYVVEGDEDGNGIYRTYSKE